MSDDLKYGTFVHVPHGYAALVYRVPTSEDTRDDAEKILDALAGTPRGAAPTVANLIDHDEQNEIDG